MARRPTETVQLNLRFSEALRRKLEREAARTDRSMNAEIIQSLEASFSVPELTAVLMDQFADLQDTSSRKMIESFSSRVGRLEARQESLRELLKKSRGTLNNKPLDWQDIRKMIESFSSRAGRLEARIESEERLIKDQQDFLQEWIEKLRGTLNDDLRKRLEPSGKLTGGKKPAEEGQP